MNIKAAKATVIDRLSGEDPESAYDIRSVVWYALARLVRGRDLDSAFDYLERSLSTLCMFTVPGYVRAVLRHREQIREPLFDRIVGALTDGFSYEGLYDSKHTENHKVMLAATRLLVAQAFPDRRIDGVPAETAYKASLDWLRAWGESRCVYGHPECHSSIYCMAYTMPLLNLRDLATDPEVSRMAEMMTDYIALHHAINRLGDMYAGAHSRAYDHTLVNTTNHPSQLWSFPFYGAGSMVDPRSLWLLFTAADTDYVPHEAILAAARERNAPYEIRERHGEVGSNGVPVEVQRYTYITRSFALGSLQGHAWPDNQLRWSLKAEADDPFAMIFTNQPTKTEKAGVWDGASEYEHLVQHRNAIIALYNIPETDPHPSIHGHFPFHADEWSVHPEELLTEQQPQWICLRVGSTYVGIYPLAPFYFRRRAYTGDNGTLQNPVTCSYCLFSTFEGRHCWELVGPHRRHGVVLEASQSTEWPSFDAFVAVVTQSRPDVDESAWQVRHRMLDGTVIELGNPGPLPHARSFVGAGGEVPSVLTHEHYRAQRPPFESAVGDARPDYAAWPSVECRFASSVFGSGVHLVEAGGKRLKLDFRNWTKEA